MAESSEYPAAFCRAIADAVIEIRRSNPGLVDSAAAAAPSPLLALPDIDRGSIFGHESSSDHELHDCDSEDMEASTAARSPEFAALRPPSILPASRQPRAKSFACFRFLTCVRAAHGRSACLKKPVPSHSCCPKKFRFQGNPLLEEFSVSSQLHFGFAFFPRIVDCTPTLHKAMFAASLQTRGPFGPARAGPFWQKPTQPTTLLGP
jgi:hypothetical protein